MRPAMHASLPDPAIASPPYSLSLDQQPDLIKVDGFGEDLGIADSTVIWFFQTVGRETRVIDVLKGEGVGLDWYAKRLRERDWLWGDHHLPHDAEVRELGTGKSRIEVLAELGIRGRICPNMPVEDGIQAARMLLEMARRGTNRLIGRTIPAPVLARESFPIPPELLKEESAGLIQPAVPGGAREAASSKED
jgi:hypothetical protein